MLQAHPHTPHSSCAPVRVTKPAPVVPVLFTQHLHHENVVAGEMKLAVCVVFPPHWKWDQNHILHLFTSCLAWMGCSSTSFDVRGKDMIWLCGPSPWTSPVAGESWKFDLVSTGPSTRATEQIWTELRAQGPSSRLPLLLPNTWPRAFSRMQSLAPSCALSL